MRDMSTPYAVTLAVTTDVHLTDEQSRDVAARWAADTGLELGMTSTSLDEPWLRVSGIAHRDPLTFVEGTRPAPAALVAVLATAGARVAQWHSIEVLSAREIERRSRNIGIPPLVNARELAELAGIRTQRVYQLESERATGKRTDFPTPVVEGYWLRSAAEHWARNRKTKPGPEPKRDDA